MYDVYIKIGEISPVENNQPGSVSMSFNIKPKGKWMVMVAHFTVTVRFESNEKTIDEIISEAKKQALEFAGVLASTANFVEE